MRFILCAAVVGVFAVGIAVAVPSAADDEKPKYSIKDVMGKAHKGGQDALVQRIIAGKGNDSEKKELVEYYTALGKNDPPKGEQKSWDDKTKALLDAAKEVQEGKDGGADNLKKAANCMACHKEHRG
ncbi:MAG TPA: hypothetical protein VML55_10425 [Planctomycetaceae bacterium]|nr:hypothetical protein [Planctomycetaceae bacterium]